MEHKIKKYHLPGSLNGYFILLFLIFFLFAKGCAGSKKSISSGKQKKMDRRLPNSFKPYRIGNNCYKPLVDARGFKQRGLASWYGKDFHGKKTANGEIYNMYGLSAAHKTLPLGTWVRVRRFDNGEIIDLRINDRGPFVKGRIIDLSRGAAKKIGMIEAGTVPVEIVALEKKGKRTELTDISSAFHYAESFTGNYTIQVGAFSDLKNAEKLKNELDQFYKNAHIKKGGDDFYRVRVGTCSTLHQAVKYEERLMQNGYNNIFIVAQ